MAGEHGGATPALPVAMGAKERRVHRAFRQQSSMECLMECTVAASAQKLQLAFHLTLECEELWTSLLVTPMAAVELLGSGRVRLAWTDVGSVGVERRPFLTKIAKFCQGLSHLRLDPVDCGLRSAVTVRVRDAGS